MTQYERPIVHIWTDGSTTPRNPGPGGWGTVLILKSKAGATKKTKAYYGSSPHASNIRMELTAVLRGLQELKAPSLAVIHTDSQYVIDGFKKLKRHQFLKSHLDIWGQLLFLSQIHSVFTKKVKAHTGIPLNEEADALAKKAAKGQEGDMYMSSHEEMVQYLREKRRIDESEA